MKKGKMKSQRGEKVFYESRPRFLIKLKSVLIKFIVLLLIIYLFGILVRSVAVLQNYIIKIIQLPIVEVTTLIVLLLIFILILWIIWDIISWRSTKYLLSNHRIIIQKGVLRKSRIYIHYDKIQDVTVTRSLIQRIFYCGDVEIFGGHEHTRIFLEDIPDPLKAEEMIDQMIEGNGHVYEESLRPSKIRTSEIRKSVMTEHSKKFKR